MHTLTKWSLKDYHKMIESGILNERRVELILGEIINMSPQGPIHRFISHSTVKYLRSKLLKKAEVMEAHPVTLGNSEPEPDLAIVRAPDTLYLSHHPYPEDIYWLIEIADTTLVKDLGIKKKMYAQANIPEYWVIDITSEILKVFRYPLNENYQEENDYENGKISPLAFPQIEISVSKLLANKH